MLCPDCRRQVTRGAAFCGSCGRAARRRATRRSSSCWPSGERVPLIGDVVIGRAPASTLRLDDPSVSRTHARISAGNGTARIEDAGSSHGTFVDDARIERPVALRDGARIRVGDQELGVERRRELAEAGRTLVVRPGSTRGRRPPPASRAQATQFGMRPRVRSGYALKRMDADEGPRRWVLRDLSPRLLPAADRQRRRAVRAARRVALAGRPDRGVRAALRPDGRGAARPAAGRSRRARLPGGRGERGADAERPASFWRRLVTPREKVVRGLGPFFDALYRRGGWVLFTRPLLCAHRGALRGRRGRVRAAHRPALRDAVRGRGQDRHRRPRLPARPLPGGRGARDRARADDGVVRPAGREGGPEAHRDLPVRVRGHERGVVRAAPAADRDQRGRAGGGLLARRDLLASAASRCPRATSATSSSSSPSPATSARSSTSTRSWSATATTCSSTGCASRGCAGGRASSSRGGWPASRRPTTRRCSRATPLGPRVVGARRGLRDRDDAALRAGHDRARVADRRAHRDGDAVGGVLRPRAGRRRQPLWERLRAVWEHEPWPLTSPTSPRG